MHPKSKTSAILQGKCPRCREGNMFPYGVFKLTHLTKMNEHCPTCGLRFEVEPGFFIGAMYVSYAFTVAIVITVGVVLSFFYDPTLWEYLGCVVIVTLAFLPFSFRYSRILYLHWFGGIDFDPNRVN